MAGNVEKARLQQAIQRGLLPLDLADALWQQAEAAQCPWWQLAVEQGLLDQTEIDSLDQPPAANGPPTTDVPTMANTSSPHADVAEADTILPGHTVPTIEPQASQGGPADFLALRNWGHYDFVRFLGKGGMGYVFQAFDNHLRRQVAIKTLADDDPTRIHRFIQEARAQARVEHEHICRIHEVNESEGRPYIVMQLVRGDTLTQMADQMSLEQKLLVMKQVAFALHEAHRAGLIHRDLKPSNIMVETTEDGRFNPVVLDFGLARLQTEESATVDGSFLGTPGYMAPEQVRGQKQKIDRRSDVYGLGATLYHLLTGAPPFGHSTDPAILMDIMDKEPPPLRNKGFPVDVETIVLKCLQKDSAKRYDSAKALGEDLGRYLDGDPILARRQGLVERMVKLARKNRAAVAVAAVAAILVTAALTWGAVTAYRAEVREELTREFTTQAEEIEALARYAHMSRLHDIRPDRLKLRTRMQAIETKMQRLGSLAKAPGHYALGRGYLSLEEYDQALDHLQKAWSLDYRDPEVAYALVKALSHLYRREWANAQLIREASERQRREQTINEAYREPALVYMSHCTDLDLEAPEYLQALAAFNQNRLDETIAILEETQTRMPWFYEAPTLQGEAYQKRAHQAALSGDQASARVDFEKAIQALEKAAHTAASDPSIYRTAGRTYILMMANELFAGEDLEPLLDAGLKQFNRALTVDPSNGLTWNLKARLHTRMAQRQFIEAENPVAHLEAAEAAAQKSAAFSPSSAMLALGQIYSVWAQWQKQKSLPFRDTIRQSIEALEQVHPADFNYDYFSTLGSAYRLLAAGMANQSEDPLPAYTAAITAYRRAIDISPELFSAHANLGECLMAQAAHEPPAQAVPLYRQVVTAYQRAKSLNDSHPVPYYYLGRAYLRLAQGGDPTKGTLNNKVSLALNHYREGRKHNPKLIHFYSGELEIHTLSALDAWIDGRDPTPHLAAGEAIYGQGLAINDKFPYLYQNMAWIAYYRGKFRVRLGQAPGGALQQAIELSQHALTLFNDSGSHLCIGSAYRLLAEDAVYRGMDPSRHVEAAEATFRSILASNDQYPEAHRSLGRLYTLQAQWRERTNQPAAKIRQAYLQADEHLRRALALGNNVDFLLAAANHALFFARWLKTENKPDYRDWVTRGNTLIEQALQQQSNRPYTRVLQAHLNLLTAADEGQAMLQLHQALTDNPNLVERWSFPSAIAKKERP